MVIQCFYRPHNRDRSKGNDPGNQVIMSKKAAFNSFTNLFLKNIFCSENHCSNIIYKITHMK
jgi:hypothetical protein